MSEHQQDRNRGGVRRRDDDSRSHQRRDSRDRRRSRSPDHHRTRRDDRSNRSRSRSPRRHEHRDRRQRSPPRGPRGHHDREREPPRDPKSRDRYDKDDRTSGQSSVKRTTIAGGRPDNKPPSGGKAGNAMEVDEEELDEEALLRKIMGFGGFKSTKNTKVPGNDKLYAVRKDKETQYRQYMNRSGGFNRPLSPG